MAEESAVSQVLSLGDCLTTIGDHIYSRKSLHALCLVNKRLNAVFSPDLYSHISLRGQDCVAFDDTIDRIIASNWLVCTKSLELDNFSHPTYGAPTTSRLKAWKILQEQIVRLISHTPNLRKIVWRNTHITKLTIKEIHRLCPHIEQLSAESLSYALEKTRSALHSRELAYISEPCPLSFPAHLTSLRLYNLRGNVSQWVEDIVGILINSPGLLELGISLNHNELIEQHATFTDCRGRGHPHTTRCNTQPEYANFFPNLCEEYLKKEGVQLKLTSLKLGMSMMLIKGLVGFQGVAFDEDDKIQGMHALSSFMDLTKVNDLAIFNRGIIGVVKRPVHCILTASYGSDGFAWLASSLPNFFPNLRVLSLLHLNPVVARALAAVDWGYMSKLGLHIGDWEVYQLVHPNHSYHTLRAAFGTHQLAIRPRALWLPRLSESIDFGLSSMSTVRTLSMEIPRDFYDSAFTKSLAGMPNLEHLWLRCRMCRQEQDWDAKTIERKRHRSWYGAPVHGEHLLQRVSKLELARHCSRLRYLRVCHEACSIVRQESPAMATMRDLDEFENRAVTPEFFRYEGPPSLSGRRRLRMVRYT